MNQQLKLAGAAVLFLAAGGFFYIQYLSVQPSTLRADSIEVNNARVAGAAPPMMGGGPGGRMNGPEGMMSEEERKAQRAEVLDQLGLTPEQRAKLEEIEARFAGQDPREAWRGRMEASAEVLTPEQREKAQQLMRDRMRGRMEERLKMLPEGERDKFRQKLEQRMSERRGRMEARMQNGESPRGPRPGEDGPPQ
ncbi:MAG: hypothetical protein SF028_09305 [Candidatus Sumerlaeia bacterium]|nr:hypothetical protein [Candidatus Sumerlaeia bacterium]